MKKALFLVFALLLVVTSCKKDSQPGKKFAVPQAIDLGINVNGKSIKWASFDVGADKPAGQGVFFSWGELAAKDEYDWNHYLFGVPDTYKVTRYCPGDNSASWGGSGNPDGLSVLQSADDVARQKIGKKWRMPTFDEIKALLDTRTNPEYEWKFDEEDGVKGFWVISMKAGTEGNRIFLPFSGSISSGGEPQSVGIGCSYWSSTLDSSVPNRAYCLYTSHYPNGEERVGWGSVSRSQGYIIRPVCE